MRSLSAKQLKINIRDSLSLCYGMNFQKLRTEISWFPLNIGMFLALTIIVAIKEITRCLLGTTTSCTQSTQLLSSPQFESSFHSSKYLLNQAQPTLIRNSLNLKSRKATTAPQHALTIRKLLTVSVHSRFNFTPNTRMADRFKRYYTLN